MTFVLLYNGRRLACKYRPLTYPVRKEPIEPLLVSLHIPKTGGSTLLDVLIIKFGDRLQRAYQPPKEGLKKSKSDGWPDIPHPLCIHGHAVMRRFGKMVQSHPHTQWITFVRDPLERAISTYFYAKRTKPWNPHRKDRPIGTDVEDYLLRHYNHNRFRRRFDNTGKAHEDFTFIGITEYFDESMFLLYEALGWKPIYYAPQNVGAYVVPELSNRTIREFKTINEADYEIYSEALRFLRRRKEDYGSRFEGDFSKFRLQLH